MERVENDLIAIHRIYVYVDECAGSHSMGRPHKRWINTVKNCLRKRGLDIRQARRMVHDRGKWRGFVRGNT